MSAILLPWLGHGLLLLALLSVAALVRRNLRDYHLPLPPETPTDPLPPVSVLVPARNEAAGIEACLEGLLAQGSPVLEVLVLDDASTDDTAARVERLAARHPRLRLLPGEPLPPGWAGKAHACAQLARQARGEWLLFVDADTRARPGLVCAALGVAVSRQADLLSTFPRQVCGTPGEALAVPLVYWLLFTLLPLRRVWEDPSPAFAAACGQLLLARAAAYRQVGGHAALPASLHDGLHLARLYKRHGRRVVLADLSPWISCRMYRGLGECWRGFTRNVYQGLGSPGALAALTAAQFPLFVVPWLGLAAGAALGWPGWAWLCAAQAGVLLGIAAALRRRFRFPWLTVALLPLALLLLLVIPWAGALRTWCGRPAIWKGRSVGATPAGPAAPEPAVPSARPHTASHP